MIAPGLRSQRLAGGLVEDFCARLAAAGYVAVHTHFGPEPMPVRARVPASTAAGAGSSASSSRPRVAA